MSCKVITVPRSSSLTNVLESPDIAEKNITIHRIPASRLGETLSPAMEKRTIESVTTTNITRALSAYLVFSSDCKSFVKTVTVDFIQVLI